MADDAIQDSPPSWSEVTADPRWKEVDQAKKLDILKNWSDDVKQYAEDSGEFDPERHAGFISTQFKAINSEKPRQSEQPEEAQGEPTQESAQAMLDEFARKTNRPREIRKEAERAQMVTEDMETRDAAREKAIIDSLGIDVPEAAKKGYEMGSKAGEQIGSNDLGKKLMGAAAAGGNVLNEPFKAPFFGLHYAFKGAKAAAEAGIEGDKAAAINSLATPDTPVTATESTNVQTGNEIVDAILNVGGDTAKSVLLENPEMGMALAQGGVEATHKFALTVAERMGAEGKALPAIAEKILPETRISWETGRKAAIDKIISEGGNPVIDEAKPTQLKTEAPVEDSSIDELRKERERLESELKRPLSDKEAAEAELNKKRLESQDAAESNFEDLEQAKLENPQLPSLPKEEQALLDRRNYLIRNGENALHPEVMAIDRKLKTLQDERLSNIVVDENWKPQTEVSESDFVTSPKGEINFGVLDEEASINSNGKFPSAPIRLQEGMPGHEGFGRQHVSTNSEKMGKIKELGYENEVHFIHDVTENYNKVYEQENGRLLLIKENGKDKVAVIELQPNEEGGFYGVTSAFTANKGYGPKKGVLLIDRAAYPMPKSEASAPYTTPEVTSSEPLGAGARAKVAPENIEPVPSEVKPKLFTDDAAARARERIEKRRKEGRVLTGLDPEPLADYTIIGVNYVESGLRNFASWSGAMLKEFGEVIKPHLKDVWARVSGLTEVIERQRKEEGYSEGVKFGRASEKNRATNKLEEVKRQGELSLLKQDMKARDKHVNEVQSVKNLMVEKLAEAKRKGELVLLKQDMKARDSRNAIVAQLRNKLEDQVETITREFQLENLKTDILHRETLRLKSQVADYVIDNLPIAQRGKFIKMIVNAESQNGLARAFARVDEAVKDVEKRSLAHHLKRTVEKLSESPSVDAEYRNQIKALANEFVYNKPRADTLARLKATQDFINEQRAAGKTVDLPQAVLDELKLLKSRPIADMPIDQIQALIDRVEELGNAGKLKVKTRESLYEYEKHNRLKEIQTGSTPLNTRQILKSGIDGDLSAIDRLRNIWNRAANAGSRVGEAIMPMNALFDLLDGLKHYTGANYRIFKANIDRLYNGHLNYLTEKRTAALKLAEDLELNKNNFERIGVHAARVQEGGIRKLLSSGYTEEFIESLQLTANEMRWYKQARSDFDSMLPEVTRVTREVYNLDVPPVEDYFPFITDYSKLEDSAIHERFGNEEAPFTPTNEGTMRKKNVQKGFTIERKGGDQKIKVNAFDIYMRHTEDASYLIHMGREIKLLTDIAKTPEYKAAVGDAGQLMVLDWLDVLARNGGSISANRIPWIDAMRKRMGVGTLGFKLSSIVVQPTALLDGAAIIGNHAFKGAFDLLSKERRSFLMKNFPELRERVADPFLKELLAPSEPSSRAILAEIDEVLKPAQRMSMKPMQALDEYTASAITMGAYNKFLADRGISFDATKPNAEGVAYAQRVLQQTQASSYPKDIPLAFSTGRLTGSRSLNRGLLQFQSFMLARWSLIRHDLIRYGIEKKDFAKASKVLAYISGALLLESGIRTALKAPTSDKEPEQIFTDQMVGNTLGSVPFVSQSVGLFAYTTPRNPVPTVQAVNDLTRGLRTVAAGKKSDTKLRGAIQTAQSGGQLLGVPGSVQAGELARAALLEEKKKK